MTHHAIQTQQLTRDFGSTRAVDKLTLEIPHGVVFGLLGPRKSGKTTTIRMLLGLLNATSGSAQVLGYDTTTQANRIRAQTGVLMAHDGLNERLTVWENLEFYGRIYRMPEAKRQARIKELLKHINLWEQRDDMVRDWSKDIRHKLAIARAFLHNPQVVILDEPSAVLEPDAVAALHDDLTSMITKKRCTVLISTRNPSEAEKLCQQIGIIRKGRLVKVGSPDVLRGYSESSLEIVGHNFNQGILAFLRAYPEVTSVRLTTTNAKEHILLQLARSVEAEKLVNVVQSVGGQVETVKQARSSLEDVFMTLVKDQEAEV